MACIRKVVLQKSSGEQKLSQNFNWSKHVSHRLHRWRTYARIRRFNFWRDVCLRSSILRNIGYDVQQTKWSSYATQINTWAAKSSSGHSAAWFLWQDWKLYRVWNKTRSIFVWIGFVPSRRLIYLCGWRDSWYLYGASCLQTGDVHRLVIWSKGCFRWPKTSICCRMELKSNKFVWPRSRPVSKLQVCR